MSTALLAMCVFGLFLLLWAILIANALLRQLEEQRETQKAFKQTHVEL